MKSFVGKQFTRLTVLSAVDPVIDKHGKARTAYLCQCSCGTILTITRHALQNKNGIKSCGCLNNENRSKLGLSKRKSPPHISTAKQIFLNRYSDGDLTLDDFLKISQQNCYYCDCLPSAQYNRFAHRKGYKVSDYAVKEGTFKYNGLDRIDSALPHNLENVVPCCVICNRAKSNTSQFDFKEWIGKVFRHWAKE